MPKHLLALGVTGRPLVTEAYERLQPAVDEVHLLTEPAQVDALRAVLPGVRSDQFIIEPMARGTAAAYGLAALTLERVDPGALMTCAPSDHVVRSPSRYRQVLQRALRVAAAEPSVVLVGLKPTYPATGLGYIQSGPPHRIAGVEVREVVGFFEKPELQRACEYLAAGSYYWNLAYFTFRASVLLEELARHAPIHRRAIERVVKLREKGDEAGAQRAYHRLPAEPIDKVVMERSDRLRLIPASFGWHDIGAWPELASVRRADADGNLVEGDAVLLDTRDSILLAPTKLVAAIGVADIVVVETDDAILVCDRSRAQDVKRVVEELRQRGFHELL